VTFKLNSIVPVWVAVLLGTIAVGLFSSRDEHFTWLAIVLAGGVILTFVAQLIVPVKEGLVLRVMTSIGGSVLILAVATALLAVLDA